MRLSSSRSRAMIRAPVNQRLKLCDGRFMLVAWRAGVDDEMHQGFFRSFYLSNGSKPPPKGMSV